MDARKMKASAVNSTHLMRLLEEQERRTLIEHFEQHNPTEFSPDLLAHIVAGSPSLLKVIGATEFGKVHPVTARLTP